MTCINDLQMINKINSDRNRIRTDADNYVIWSLAKSLQPLEHPANNNILFYL